MDRFDTPDNYYGTLGVPIDANSDTIKRAYRQLARRYHPDIAGPEGAVQMKRINRAYDVLRDPQKRLNYDTILGGVVDLRNGGLARPRPMARKFEPTEDIEFSGLSIFSTKGPLHAGPRLQTQIGVISTISYVRTDDGERVGIGTLDGAGLCWRVGSTDTQETQVRFAADPSLTVESLRELRFSPAGGLLAGWGRLGLHVWDTQDGSLLWSYALGQRAISAHYSLDVVLREHASGERGIVMALPIYSDDPRGPRARGVRGTGVVSHIVGTAADALSEPLVCAEDDMEKRQFWAIRLRTLSRDARILLTLSCANVPQEKEQMIVIRRWDLTARSRFGGKLRPQISTSIIAGCCAECEPPYTMTPDVRTLAYRYAGHKVRLYDITNGLFSELPSGGMGGSARMAISPDAQWLAVAREDSEVNEGVVDLWSVPTGQLVQKMYHPWQISALHYTEKQLIVALTDGTVQIWQ
ncbi:MAG TPA: DnaJ domain-containing protein [Ktedonobacteraceae bacterium]|nr:DnaJ domain-containing protein [Ktedonobacteraceae bacterium]